MAGPARNTNTIVDELLKFKRERAKGFGLARQQFSGVSYSASSGGAGSKGSPDITGGEAYLKTGGDTMIGPIAYYPKAATIAAGVLDVGVESSGFSSRVIVSGEGAADDDLNTISNVAHAGQMLFLQPIITNTITLKHNVDNIFNPQGTDVIVAGGQTVVLQWDTVVHANKWVVLTGNAISGAGDNLGNHIATQDLLMNENPIFYDTLQNMHIEGDLGAGTMRYYNDHTTNGAHAFFVDDTVTPKFRVTETFTETNVNLHMEDNTLRFDTAQLISITETLGQNLNYVVDVNDGNHFFYVDSLLNPVFTINETLVSSSVNVDVEENNILNSTSIDFVPSAWAGLAGGKRIRKVATGFDYDLESNSHQHRFVVGNFDTTPTILLDINQTDIKVGTDMKMQENPIFFDTLENMHIEGDLGAGTMRYYNDTALNGAHAFFVDDTVTPKFRILETLVESNVQLQMEGNTIFFDTGGLISIVETLDANLNYTVDVNNGNHNFYVDNLVTPKFKINETLITANVDIDIQGNQIINTGTLSLPTTTGALLSTGEAWAMGDGIKATFNPNGTTAGLNVGLQAGDPSSTFNGDIWYNSTTHKFRAKENSVNVDMIGGGGGSSFADNVFEVFDDITSTKKIQFSLATATGTNLFAIFGTSDTYTFPDGGGTVVMTQGTQTIGGAKTFSTTFTASSTANFNGTVNMNSHVNLGNGTTDNISVDGRVNTDVDPDATNTYDLGSTTLRWDIVYSTTFNVDAGGVTNTAIDIADSGGIIKFDGNAISVTASAGSVTPPSQVVGYINCKVGGTNYRIPYYLT